LLSFDSRRIGGRGDRLTCFFQRSHEIVLHEFQPSAARRSDGFEAGDRAIGNVPRTVDFQQAPFTEAFDHVSEAQHDHLVCDNQHALTGGGHAVQPDEREEEALDKGLAEGEIIYRSVRQDGMVTLQETTAALVWSGIAAGISMGFSMIAEGLLQAHLPHALWTPLVTKLGYAVGFLIVILGRQELFTEQTLSAILPLLSRDEQEHGSFANVARVWAVILAANLVGAAAFAAFAAWGVRFGPWH